MSKKSNTEEFIEKAKNLHNNKYCYSNVNYVNENVKIKIFCSIHGIFLQTPHSHLAGKGCPECGGKLKLNTITFIEKAKIIHGNKYSYIETNYINTHTKVKIICPIHGVFEQTPSNHLHGYGCLSCGGKYKLNTEEFIERAKIIHNNKFDYSETIYNNIYDKVKIICPTHGIFKQIPNSHLLGNGCPKCIGRNKTTKEFINEANIIHNNKYIYFKVKYLGNRILIKIICPIHGVFKQTPHSHLSGAGCPQCNCSKGELLIKKILDENNIIFVHQKRFENCRGKKNKLSFDYYLPDYNIIIEYDGKQHYKPINFNGCSDEQAKKTHFELIQNDIIKNKYCTNNGIKLIRIPYYEKNIKNYLNTNLIIE